MFLKAASRVARALSSATGGFFQRNIFIYKACLSAGIRFPTIPIPAAEHYGQFSEDLIVMSLLEAKAAAAGIDLTKQKYLEIGGNHPFATSTTYLLHKRLGMNGVIVEANPALIPQLKKGRPGDEILYAAIHDDDAAVATLVLSKFDVLSSLDQSMVHSWEDGAAGETGRVEVPAMRINDVVARYLDNVAPAFVSIDTEGNDLRILRDLDFTRYRPWFVQVEYLDNFRPPGNSAEISEFMRSVGYRLVSKTIANLIFADSV